MDNDNNKQVNTNQEPFHYRYPIITVSDWMITMLIMSLPILNVIMLFIWGFSSDGNPNKANWAKANLIWIAIAVGGYIVIALIALAAFGGIEGLVQKFNF